MSILKFDVTWPPEKYAYEISTKYLLATVLAARDSKLCKVFSVIEELVV